MERTKRQRAQRKGRMSQIQKALDVYQDKPIQEYDADELDDLLETIEKISSVFLTHQEEITAMVTEAGDADAIEAEQTEAISNEKLVQHVRRLARRYKDNLSFYTEIRQLEEEFEDWERVADPKSKSFYGDVNHFTSLISELEARLNKTSILHETVKAQHTSLRKMSQRVRELSYGPTSKEGTTKPSSTTTDSHFKLYAPTPTFDGSPLKWVNFKQLFEHGLNTRGSHLDDYGKSCLLLKAMDDVKAREIVQLHAKGDAGYAKAMKALEEAYGTPNRILPQLLKTIQPIRTITYSAEGMSIIHKQFGLTMDALVDLKVDLSTYLAAEAVTRFDHKLKEEWVKHTASMDHLPNLDDLRQYASRLSQCIGEDTEQEISNVAVIQPAKKSQSSKQKSSSGNVTTKSSSNVCIACNGKSHSLSKCSKFMDMTPERRGKLIREHSWCTNCLYHSHTNSNCTSKHTCRHCGQRHHSLLHRGAVDSGQSTLGSVPVNMSTRDRSRSARINHQQSSGNNKRIFNETKAVSCLPTALVHIKNGQRRFTARLAFDSGAAINVITEDMATRLRLKRYPQQLTYTGAGGCEVSKSFVQTTIISRHDPNKQLPVELCVVSKLPHSPSPPQKEALLNDPKLADIPFADEDFGGPLDILVGSYDDFKSRQDDRMHLPEIGVGLCETVFGWTVVAQNPRTEPPVLTIHPVDDDLDESLQKLWELEKTPECDDYMSTEDELAMRHFAETHQILPDGRYQVKLPRPHNPPPLGSSRHIAAKRFQGNEKTMTRRNLLPRFNGCMQEYLDLDHAEVAPSSAAGQVNYLPVHGVQKEASTTTKLRPVFDASARTSTGVSLNDTLLTGPTLHPNLIDLLVRFRTHTLGMSADISKMFREVSLHPEERDLHRFLMRDKTGTIQECRMKRLTFGVRPSPYLATQVLQHLAITHQDTHPRASSAIIHSFYVDDFLGGAETIEEAKTLRLELCDLLSLGCMTLRKWRSSDNTFLHSIPDSLIETEPLTLSSTTDTPKALGVHWDVSTDVLRLAIPTISTSTPQKLTKRIVASLIPKVYDVLGLFAPFTVAAKMMLQAIWKLGISWDQAVPDAITLQWDKWKAELGEVHGHAIQRRYTQNNSPVVKNTLHGFCDASESAYGAAVYLRQEHLDGSVSVALVIGKARVAPLKALTIPRAELVGAHLLAKLLIFVCRVLHVPHRDVTAWTDSTIVLCWLRKSPSSLKPYTANRVAFIQNNISEVSWRHVPTQDNPADLLSRGSTAAALRASCLWWQGPAWLAAPSSQWPHNTYNLPTNIPELRAVVLTICPITTQETEDELWTRYSSFTKLCRVLAWVRRFIKNARAKDGKIISPHLLQQEVSDAEAYVFRKIQKQHYSDIISLITSGKSIPRSHHFHKYQLSMDNRGLLRLSGRVRNSTTSTPQLLIPLSIRSELTRLMINTSHYNQRHPGISTLMAILNETFHIPAVKRYLKKLSRQCVTCQRAYAQPVQPTMGVLPSVRTTPSTPFENTGVDFAGPFTLLKGRTRRPVHIKAYVCLFICLSTRAIHLELCMDLTTSSFLAAITRFTSRRSTPANFYSDNATNFIGAASELRRIQDLLTTSEEALLQIPHTNWHFIPPRAPHFGGMWESGVKQMKVLMKKYLTQPLTAEELTTILAEVEATLNSRPLIETDAMDPDSILLTSGHFLIGKPIRSRPQDQAPTGKISALKRWSLVQRLFQDLWTAWKAHYLRQLQSRNKWQNAGHNLKVNDVVLVKDEILRQPTGWPLARVTTVYPGDDKQVRTVDIFCNGREYKRASNRLVYLLSQDD